MIPKIIHYCWFGGREIPADLRGYMATWARIMPNWQIVRWDETNFDIASAPLYVRQAYEAKKFAFVSDYVRLYALRQMGGVYMDVDVEIVRPLDELPEFMTLSPSLAAVTPHSPTLTAFLGFEENKFRSVGTCLIGSEAGAAWLEEQLAYYQERSFKLEDGSYDMTTNSVIISRNLEKHGFIRNGEEQVVKFREEGERKEEEGVHVYDFHHFSPLTSTRVMRANSNTYAIHHYAESWKAQGDRKPYHAPIVNEAINAMIQVKRLLDTV